MRFWLLTFFGLLLAAGPAAARLVGDTEVPFSADRVATWKGKSYEGRIYAVPGMQRHEQDIKGLRVVAILRADREQAYLMLPDLHIYTAIPFPKAVTEEGDASHLGAPVATETVGGEAAGKYHVARQGSDGSALDGFLWMASGGVLLKLDGTYADPGHTPNEGVLTLTAIHKGPQDPALFEVPADVKELPPQALQMLFNLRVAKPHS